MIKCCALTLSRFLYRGRMMTSFKSANSCKAAKSMADNLRHAYDFISGLTGPILL